MVRRKRGRCGRLATAVLLVVTWRAAAAFAPLPAAGHRPHGAAAGGAVAPPGTVVKAGRTRLYNMMFDQLTGAISQIATTLGGNGKRPRITEASIQTALRDTRRALLDADVNIGVADALIDGVRARALGQDVLPGVTADQQFIKALYDELVDLFGGDAGARGPAGQPMASLPAATLAAGTLDRPAVVLLAGLQGAGKTTAAGKLALYLKEREVDYEAAAALQQQGQLDPKDMIPSRLPKRKRKVLLVAADVYRPAAIRQLQILGESIDVEVYTEGTDVDPVQIVTNGIAHAKAQGVDTVVVDTAGRQVIDTNLMDELKRIQQAARPDETLLVVDAMTGQEAATLTAAFDATVPLTGAILTKMDGDSRGGAALSVRGVSGKAIKFVGTGERTTDLEPFYPDRMASRILGMGDVVSLVEKATAEVSDADALKMDEKLREGKFDFDDFLKQTELLGKMGNIAGVARMMPGIGGQIDNKQLREVEKRLQINKSMIACMTPEERANPDLFIKDREARARLSRIAQESGRSVEEASGFISQFQQMRTMMRRMQKQMSGKDPSSESEDLMSAAGNRASRRAAKKNKKQPTRGFGGGFG